MGTVGPTLLTWGGLGNLRFLQVNVMPLPGSSQVVGETGRHWIGGEGGERGGQ